MCTRVNSLHETLHLWVFASSPLPLLAEHNTSTNISAASSASTGSSASGIRVDLTPSPSLRDLAPDAYDLQSSPQFSSEASSYLRHDQESYPECVYPAYYDANLPASMLEQIQLIQVYLKDTGTWCEVTDLHRHFTVSYIHRLMGNKPFVAAAMALASRQLDIIRKSPQDSTLSLY
jgi:hypothetical protein